MAQSLHQFDVDDDSPEIAYFPFANLEPSPNVTAGWQLLYSGSGAATSPGQVGVGTSFHYTSLNGASFTINWNGTGIDLIGSVSNALYNISLDGTVSTYGAGSSTNTVLASFDGLENTNHSLLLTTIMNTTSPDAFLIFDKARITFAPPAGIPNTTATSQVLVDSGVAFKGEWSFETDSAGKSVHVSNSAGDRAETTFIGSAITIYGLTSSYSGNFTVTLDHIATNLTALSSYNNSDTLLFYATDLSQNTTHHIAVINQENRTLALQVGGMNVTSFGNQTTSTAASSTSSSVPAGTVAAAVLAAVLFLVIVGIFYYACFVRRKARSIDRHTFTRGILHRSHEKGGGATHTSPPSGEDLEYSSLSTSKGYGFGLGLRREFPFAYRKGKVESSSSGKSRNGVGGQAESYAMTTQWGRDEKRFSINTLTEDLPVLTQTPESEKLAPGWYSPAAHPPHPFRYSLPYENMHSVVIPEIYVEHMDDDDDADVKTLTSRQDETLDATLSLSPRTSEAHVTFEEVMLSKLGLDVQDGPGPSYSENQRPEFLDARSTSPFRVDMSPIFGARKSCRNSRRTSESGGSTWSKVRARLYRKAHRDDGRQSYHTDKVESSSSSGPESVPVLMHESGSANASSEAAPDSGTYSFLDLAPSRIPSGRHSKATLGTMPADLGQGTKETPAWGESTSVGAEGSRDAVSPSKPDAPSTASGGSSDNSGTQAAPSATTARTQRSSPFPFPITIPLPTHTAYHPDNVPERHITPSPLHTSQPGLMLQVPQITRPELALIPADSPTESVPFSASEIHFRHSFSDYAGLDSRRASAASVLPPHPPLPHRDGSQPNTPSYSPPPPYIVQRVLGLPMSPLSPVSSPMSPSIPGRPGNSPTQPLRVGSLLGPRPRPSTAGSIRGGTSAPQLPMQGGRGNLRGPR